MIWHQIAQNTDEWVRLRLGVLTASEFHRIITPKGKLARNDTSRGYMNRLLAEWMLGCPLEEDPYESEWMQRGHELEEQAMRAYAFETNLDPQPGGFFTTDDGLIGASPDFVVGDSRLLELKCPAPHTHVGYLVRRALDDKYKPQVQGQLFVCEREIDDLQSYHPAFPTVIMPNTRDEAFIGEMEAALRQFTDEMLTCREFLEREYGPPKRPAAQQPPAENPFGVSAADVDAIVRAKFPKLETTA